MSTLDSVGYGQKGLKIDAISGSNSCYYTVNLEKNFFGPKNTDQYFI